jgi:hypothetical protein
MWPRRRRRGLFSIVTGMMAHWEVSNPPNFEQKEQLVAGARFDPCLLEKSDPRSIF